jgi:hypothetical protein
MSRAAALLLTLIAITLAAVPASAQGGGTLRGRVVAAEGALPPGLRAYVRWRARGDSLPRTDSAAVDAAGRFAIALPARLPDSVTIIVDAAGGGRRTHYPSLARVARAEADREHGFVLVPRIWTVAAGTYAGQRVSISPGLARRPVCTGCSSFWVRMPGTHTPAVYQGWPASRFPLRMAFERAVSQPAGAAPDSAAFWRAVARVEGALGRDLFRPVPFSQTLPRWPEDDPNDVVLVHVDRSIPMPGLTTMVGKRGHVEYAALTLQRASAALAPGGPELVAHELMHVLGLGHTCAWRSVMADVSRCPDQRAETPTAEDVAYTQLLYRVRDLQRDGSLRWGLDAAVEGERMLAGGATTGGGAERLATEATSGARPE